MSACKSCGAEASGIACEFCGAIQRPPQSLDDEMAALKAISEASQRFAEKKSEGFFTSDGDVQKALATFWRTAWLPTAADALVHAANTALSGLPKYDKASMAKNSPNELLFAALFARATAAVDAVAVAAPADVRVHTLRSVLEKHTKERAELAKVITRDAWLKRGLMVAVLLSPVALIWGVQANKNARSEAIYAELKAQDEAKNADGLKKMTVPAPMIGRWKSDKGVEIVIAANSVALPSSQLVTTCSAPHRLRDELIFAEDCEGDGVSSFKFDYEYDDGNCGVQLFLNGDGTLMATGSFSDEDPKKVRMCAKYNGTYTKAAL